MLPGHSLIQGNSWMPPSANQALTNFFNRVENVISSSMLTDYEHVTLYEPTITQNYIAQLTNKNSNEWKALEAALLTENIQATFTAYDIQGTEGKHGADLLFRLSVNLPHYKIDKGILCQAKRFQHGTYGDIFDVMSEEDILKGKRDQVERMLSITPASFYLLYNPPSIEITSSPGGDPVFRLSPGFQIVSAQTIAGLRGRNEDSFLTILGYSTNLTGFLMNDFFPCKVGDLFGSLGGNRLDELIKKKSDPYGPVVLRMKFEQMSTIQGE
jgi:hypothetical protein